MLFLQYDITICNQIQAHQETQEFGYCAVLFAALSHAPFLLSASSRTDADIIKVLWLWVGYPHLLVCEGFGVCRETLSPRFVVNIHRFGGL